jgi:hypothetical protein
MPSVDPSQVIDPALPDSDKYTMPLKMTVGDRRVLLRKASEARQSPTKWLVDLIHSAPARRQDDGRTSDISDNPIIFSLDRRRTSAAEQLATQLGFHQVEHLASDLLRQALEHPELAEQLLFGNLRSRSQGETNPQKKAA